ncbi:hypothetical protein L6452_26199 [Arctium lappa]|uniref:Uncharacterized protein n=1 Tax=Arctium lappa TaxID=4217 RepID=A0ACB9ACZ4_ARCLA|nr:hypothetical protein L6452_26199 [Arctium lappa]
MSMASIIYGKLHRNLNKRFNYIQVMRTEKRLGIQTVVVYSDTDRYNFHVKSTDEAVRIGSPPAREWNRKKRGC